MLLQAGTASGAADQAGIERFRTQVDRGWNISQIDKYAAKSKAETRCSWSPEGHVKGTAERQGRSRNLLSC